jgi:hypothetical protein
VRLDRPSRVMRIADHLYEYIGMLAEEVGCQRSEALDVIVEDWLDQPRNRQGTSLLSALRKFSGRWREMKVEDRDAGVAYDSVVGVKDAREYRKELGD